jgi:hypothetical protein
MGPLAPAAADSTPPPAPVGYDGTLGAGPSH